MNDYFRRKDTLATNNENALSFEIIKSDEKEETEGYSTVHIDDIHTLVDISQMIMTLKLESCVF